MSIKVETKITGTLYELIRANYMELSKGDIVMTDKAFKSELLIKQLQGIIEDNTFTVSVDYKNSINNSNKRELTTTVVYELI